MAQRLVVDERTVETHVAHALHKLGYRDRHELWADMTGWSEIRTQYGCGNRQRLLLCARGGNVAVEWFVFGRCNPLRLHVVLWATILLGATLYPSPVRADQQEVNFQDLTWGVGKTYQNNWIGNCFWFNVGLGSGGCYRGVWSDTWLSFSTHVAGVEELAYHIDPNCSYWCGDPYWSTDFGALYNPWASSAAQYITTGGYHYYCGLYGLCDVPTAVIGGAKHRNYSVTGPNWWWTTISNYGQ
jgi:hypothetical protein